MSAMLRRSCQIILLAAVSALFGGWLASDAVAGSAWDLVHPDNFDWQVRGDRRSVAADLISRVGLLAAVVPAQAPDQISDLNKIEASLETLGDAATPRQRSRLYLSRAYQHRRLVVLLRDMLAALACVRSAVSVSQEMYCWAQASALLMDEEALEISLSVLRQSRMIPRDEDMPVKAQDPKVWYSEYGRGVLRYILRPYLESQTPQGLADE